MQTIRAKTMWGGWGDERADARPIAGDDAANGFLRFALPDDGPPILYHPQAPHLAAGQAPTFSDELTFVNGLTADGRIDDTSYWGAVGKTAFKWGSGTLGTGATITYSFDKGSHFTANEKATFLKAFAMWSSVADITFKASSKHADLVLVRGDDGGAYTQTPTSNGHGTTLGRVTGQAMISIDTSVPGFDLSGSFDKFGGYGLSTIIHEVGHLLGLGHGGAYNGNVDPAHDQFSPFDDRQYTIMSYINWTNTDARYYDDNPVPNTYWGVDNQGNPRQAPHSVMAIDILDIQQLYGVSRHTPFEGGTTFGFHSNVQGNLHDFYDFTVNTSPVLTLFSEGQGNVLDVSGYNTQQLVDLNPGAFSSVGGLSNNIFVDFNTLISGASGGSDTDYMYANDYGCVLAGNNGNDLLFAGLGLTSNTAAVDTLVGGSGSDVFVFATTTGSGTTTKTADRVADFSENQGDGIYLSYIDANTRQANDQAFEFIGTDRFSRHAGELRYEVIKGDAFVSGDVNGDGKADFVIRLDDVHSLQQGDFGL